MKKIAEKLSNIKNSIGFMGHVIAGYPDSETSLEAALGICEGGADFLEVQFPFSDPTADGPTIEGACYKALEGGFQVEKGFALVEKLSGAAQTAILIMTYGNIVFKYGVEAFVRRAKETGAEGLIIPDFPIENDEGLAGYCAQYGLALILMAAPGAAPERIKELSRAGTGFLYTVARLGTTGKKTEITEEVLHWLGVVRENSVLPISAGFGIQSAEQIRAVKGASHIAVVGSHFVKRITAAVQKGEDVKGALRDETRSLLGER